VADFLLDHPVHDEEEYFAQRASSCASRSSSFQCLRRRRL